MLMVSVLDHYVVVTAFINGLPPNHDLEVPISQELSGSEDHGNLGS